MSKMSKKFITDDDYEDIVSRENIGLETTVDIVPSGLKYYENVIDEKFSDDVFEFLDGENGKKWKALSDSKNSRKVQHYGYIYDYKSRNVNKKGEKFPEVFKPLIDYLSEVVSRGSSDSRFGEFNQIIVNNYEAGQGISAHIDVKDYGNTIACFTLGSGAMMRFTREDLSYDLYVKKNSVYIMSGESRYNWKHEMVSRKSDLVDGKKIQRGRRISITFRKVSE